MYENVHANKPSKSYRNKSMIVIDVTPKYDEKIQIWSIGTKRISEGTIKGYAGNLKEFLEILYAEGWTLHEAAAAGILLKNRFSSSVESGSHQS